MGQADVDRRISNVALVLSAHTDGGKEVFDFGNRTQIRLNRLEDGVTPLQRRSGRSLDDYLEFAHVVVLKDLNFGHGEKPAQREKDKGGKCEGDEPVAQTPFQHILIAPLQGRVEA